MPQNEWNGLSADEKDSFVNRLVEYGTGFVAPLYSVVEKIEETLQQKNGALRAQADARPVAWSANWIRDQIADQIDMWPLATMPVWQIADHVRNIKITHPKASASGLSERERYLIDKAAERLREADFIDEASAVRAILASAATVAAPNDTPEQQADPGADERAAFEAAHQHLDLTMGPDAWGRPAYVHSHVEAMWAGWQARAAQSGQRGAPEQILAERKLTCEAIEGAIAFGYQNTNPPPSDDHWLAPFWKIGRKQSELEQSGQRAGVADAATRMRAAGLGALLSEVYARAGGFLDDDTRERVQQALTDHERAIAAAPTQQQDRE
jgi:hypothetical protein